MLHFEVKTFHTKKFTNVNKYIHVCIYVCTTTAKRLKDIDFKMIKPILQVRK